MSKQRKNIWKICIVTGIILLAIAGVAMAIWQGCLRIWEKQSVSYVDNIKTLLPEIQNAVPEERRDNAMSILSIDGRDFIGILEMPKFQSALPVSAEYGNISRFPSCFSGSIYDGTLQIGVTNQKGQYDFYRNISVEDMVYFTDMEGNRFGLEVKDIRYSKHADQEVLQRVDGALTLFVKNTYAFEYVIITCDVAK